MPHKYSFVTLRDDTPSVVIDFMDIWEGQGLEDALSLLGAEDMRRLMYENYDIHETLEEMIETLLRLKEAVKVYETDAEETDTNGEDKGKDNDRTGPPRLL
jgi:hypothetical protein